MMDLPVAKRIRVGRGEMTCTLCGETTNQAYCVRCGEDTAAAGYTKAVAGKGRLVPTVSYLKPEEYEVVG